MDNYLPAPRCGSLVQWLKYRVVAAKPRVRFSHEPPEFSKKLNGGSMFQTIISEMFKGNYSFAILIVGIIQCILMIIYGERKKKKK